jgi:hypothetical protein
LVVNVTRNRFKRRDRPLPRQAKKSFQKINTRLAQIATAPARSAGRPEKPAGQRTDPKPTLLPTDYEYKTNPIAPAGTNHALSIGGGSGFR